MYVCVTTLIYSESMFVDLSDYIYFLNIEVIRDKISAEPQCRNEKYYDKK